MSRVSIVIPTFNQKREYLATAVASALAQTHGDVEIILVRDGGDDVPDFDGVTKVEHEQNLGISSALNTGIKAMTGDWFCWLPSDDYFMPHKVQAQLEHIESTPLLCGFHGWYAFVSDPDKPHAQSVRWNWDSHNKQRNQMRVGCGINGLTVMIHRSVFDDVGLFDTSFKYGQDWEMWCRITRSYEWCVTNKFLACRRDSGENLTSQISKDGKLRAERDAEDSRIVRMYR